MKLPGVLIWLLKMTSPHAADEVAHLSLLFVEVSVCVLWNSVCNPLGYHAMNAIVFQNILTATFVAGTSANRKVNYKRRGIIQGEYTCVRERQRGRCAHASACPRSLCSYQGERGESERGRLHCFGQTESSKANLIGFLPIVLQQGNTRFLSFASCYSVPLRSY